MTKGEEPEKQAWWARQPHHDASVEEVQDEQRNGR